MFLFSSTYRIHQFSLMLEHHFILSLNLYSVWNLNYVKQHSQNTNTSVSHTNRFHKILPNSNQAIVFYPFVTYYSLSLLRLRSLYTSVTHFEEVLFVHQKAYR